MCTIHTLRAERATVGNIDFEELTAGSTLYLQTEVDRGLFSVDDGHAAQGDGEISVTVTECPMGRVDWIFEMLDNMPISTPVARTPAGWATIGFREDLDEALGSALEALLAVLQRLYGFERPDALALVSVTVEFRITQVVNEVFSVHAVLPHGAIRQVGRSVEIRIELWTNEHSGWDRLLGFLDAEGQRQRFAFRLEHHLSSQVLVALRDENVAGFLRFIVQHIGPADDYPR